MDFSTVLLLKSTKIEINNNCNNSNKSNKPDKTPEMIFNAIGPANLEKTAIEQAQPISAKIAVSFVWLWER